jgi:hypothetical protein
VERLATSQVAFALSLATSCGGGINEGQRMFGMGFASDNLRKGTRGRGAATNPRTARRMKMTVEPYNETHWRELIAVIIGRVGVERFRVMAAEAIRDWDGVERVVTSGKRAVSDECLPERCPTNACPTS